MNIDYNNKLVLDGGNMGSASVASETVPIQYNIGVGFQLIWSGSSISGSVKVQASCDDLRSQSATVTNWTDLSGTTVSIASDSGSLIMQLVDLTVSAVRLVYTRSAGTGSLDIRAITKG